MQVIYCRLFETDVIVAVVVAFVIRSNGALYLRSRITLLKLPVRVIWGISFEKCLKR